MEWMPVIDLRQGIVVHAVGGRRNEYAPIKSKLCAGSEPTVIAEAFREQFNLDELYVADLDAIQFDAPQWPILRQLLDHGFKLWIDAGLSSAERLDRLLALDPFGGRITGIVAGLESLTDPDAFRQWIALAGAERIVFSLDLVGGEPLVAESNPWKGLAPIAIVERAVGLGVKRMLVLDLKQVGQRGGPGSESLLAEIHRRWPALDIAAGGGISQPSDLGRLESVGVRTALLATALHERQLGSIR